MKTVQRSFLLLLLLSGCAIITPIKDMPRIVLGEASFYPTISAHTDASIISGNRVELLFNGDQIFPAMLQAIRGAHLARRARHIDVPPEVTNQISSDDLQQQEQNSALNMC